MDRHFRSLSCHAVFEAGVRTSPLEHADIKRLIEKCAFELKPTFGICALQQQSCTQKNSESRCQVKKKKICTIAKAAVGLSLVAQ